MKADGIKGLLHDLEDGAFGNVHAKTELNYSLSLIPVTYMLFTLTI